MEERTDLTSWLWSWKMRKRGPFFESVSIMSFIRFAKAFLGIVSLSPKLKFYKSESVSECTVSIIIRLSIS